MHPRLLLNEMLADRFADHMNARVLTPALTDDEWAMVEQLVPSLSVDGGRTMERAFDVVVAARRTYKGGGEVQPRWVAREPSSHRRFTRGRMTHSQAAAELFVHEIEHDTRDRFGLHRLRHEILRDRLLTPKVIGKWIKRRQRTQGSPTIDSAGQASLLAYRVVHSNWVHHVATRRDAPLDRLRQVSEKLAEAFGWHRADATVYALTGYAPRPAAIKHVVEHKVPLRARSRIVLTIDPTSTPPEVAAEYCRVRREQFGRIRRLSSKHAELAVFAMKHGHLAVAEQMSQWNVSYGRGRYRKVSVFVRDCRAALRRLADPGNLPRLP